MDMKRSASAANILGTPAEMEIEVHTKDEEQTWMINTLNKILRVDLVIVFYYL